MRLDRYNISFAGLLFSHITILLLLIDTFSISSKEADIYFAQSSTFLSLVVHFSTTLLGQNDYGLRIPFVLFYAGSMVLLYLLTKDYFRTQRDRVVSMIIFMLLPGVNSAALLVNESIIVIFGTLLYLYIYKIYKIHAYVLLVCFLFIDNSFAILFLALFFYGIQQKENSLIGLSLLLFGCSMTLYGFNLHGSPRGYLLDTIAIYATIFSPVLFLYFFYALYRIGLKWEKDLYWYISMTALVLSLFFSLRQKVSIDDFAPFVVIAIPLMVRLFLHSLRVRLRQFRTIHYMILRLSLGVLLLSFFALLLNKSFYLYLNDPSSHIANEHYIAKELAQELSKKNIDAVACENKKFVNRLKFYGIGYNANVLLSEKKSDLYNEEEIQIFFENTLIKRFYIINLTKFKLQIHDKKSY